MSSRFIPSQIQSVTIEPQKGEHRCRTRAHALKRVNRIPAYILLFLCEFNLWLSAIPKNRRWISLLLQKAFLALMNVDGLQLSQEGALSYGSVDNNCRFKIQGFSHPDENRRRFDVWPCGASHLQRRPIISRHEPFLGRRAVGRRWFNFFNLKGTPVLQPFVEAFLFTERG